MLEGTRIHSVHHNLHRNRMDDVDQRATQDLKKFCSSASELYGNLLKPILELFLLSHTLSKYLYD